MKTLLTVLLLGAGSFALAGETFDFWLCPGDVYTDRPCAGGRWVSVDPSSNLIAAEKRRPFEVGEASAPSVLMIPRPKPATFEPPAPPHAPLMFGPPTVNVRVVP